MDFPDIANMFVDGCLPCFNMQKVNCYDGQNSVFLILWRLMDFPSKGGKTVPEEFALSLAHLMPCVPET